MALNQKNYYELVKSPNNAKIYKIFKKTKQITKYFK